MIGGTVGSVAHQLLPNLTANPGAYALVGMGTAFAGIVRTPLTSVIMIFEMTRDYSIIVPLMISNLISFFISQQLQHEPIYEALALQEGVYLPTGESRDELTGIRVSQVMHPDAQPIPSEADLDTVKARLVKENCNSWPVGERNGIQGVVSLHQIEGAENKPSTLKDLLSANGNYPFVHPDHPLSYALERMGHSGVDVLPVVSRANIRQMYGIVMLGDVLSGYGVSSSRGLKEAR
jgi:CIC family chloride channel protein